MKGRRFCSIIVFLFYQVFAFGQTDKKLPFGLIESVVNLKQFNEGFFHQSPDTVSIIELYHYFNDTNYNGGTVKNIHLFYQSGHDDFLHEKSLKKEKWIIVLFKIDTQGSEYKMYFERPNTGATVTISVKYKNDHIELKKCEYGNF